MLSVLNNLVESRIKAAEDSGEFDNLPGTGKPLVLDDDPLIPEAVRVAHRILKNAGFVPPEVDKLRELAGLRSLLKGADDALSAMSREDQLRARRRLAALSVALHQRGIDLAAEGRPAPAAYVEKLVLRASPTD